MLVPCMNCYTCVRVIDEPAQIAALVGANSEYWPDKYTCVACSKPCEALFESEAEPGALEKMKVRDLTAAELFAALNGLGTPDEMQCDRATVVELLKRPMKDVRGRTLPNTSRFLIESIEFEDGTKMYFGAGAAGACVYRITRPVSYTQKVLDHG